MSSPTIGLALSGGGSRAIAFHLGCLRALHDRGILQRVKVLSGASGGSVIAALYAYSDDPFDEFSARVETMLSRGMVWGIARHTFLSPETPKIAVAIVITGAVALVGRVLQFIFKILGLFRVPPILLPAVAERVLDLLPRFASRTTAFERHLAHRYFGSTTLDAVGRDDLIVVLNAAELRTESAFRFGSVESGCWRFGTLAETPRVATAVAASAAFPALLPALDRRLAFEQKGARSTHRVIITDGGVYDNNAVSCMLPGRSSEFSTNAVPVEFIVACDAAAGIPTGARRPYFWPARMMATIATIHRRTQSMSQNLLHRLATSGEIKGFLMPYLGQSDRNLPFKPTDLITRDDTFDYPTDFSPMAKANIRKLGLRGEQLTKILIEAYAPDL